ncbi:MAG: lipocalin family protein [Victivallaceae bacterium]
MNNFFLLFSALLGGVTGCMSPPTSDIPVVENFDIAKYSGKWYEIARMPHRFERDMNFVYALYTPLEKNKIKVQNFGVREHSAKQINGIAIFAPESKNGLLKVSFFRPFYADYRIIYLNDDYTLAIVCGSTRNYLWILSRTPEISQEQMNFCRQKLIDWKFEVNLLEYPTQLSPD